MDAAAGAAIPGSVSALFVFLTRPYSLPFPFTPFAYCHPAPHGITNSVEPGSAEFFLKAL